jgi:hypothetical protein
MEPLMQLFDEATGEPVPLPAELLALYGPLRMTARRDRPHVFLTRAPIFVGRASEPATLALVEGRVFRPGTLSGRLLSARRGGDHLFLRYAIVRGEP